MANHQNNHISSTLWSMAMYGLAGATSGVTLALLIDSQLKVLPECAEFVDIYGMAILDGDDRYCIEKLAEMSFRELKALGRAHFLGHRTESALSPFWSATLTAAGVLTGALAGAAYGYRKALADIHEAEVQVR